MDIEQLLQALTSELSRKKWRIATAESCTGGLVASALTELPGSSAWFDRGFVAYSNVAKQEMLGVGDELIHRYGAVSEEVAAAMALGALQRSQAHCSLSVTGIAGPDGGSVQKPVGTVCFAYAVDGQGVKSERVFFPLSTRAEIRHAASQHALKVMYECVGPGANLR
jgi:nicotinamide-nucleotide amidase